MKVLVLNREPGEEFWYPDAAYVVIAETPNFYKVRVSAVYSMWVPKDGQFQRCEEVKEAEK